MKTIISAIALGLGLGLAPLVSNAQNVFVTNFFSNTIAGFSTTTGTPVGTFSGGDGVNAFRFPIGLATEPGTGNLYTTSIAANGDSTIFRLGPGGVQTAVSSQSATAVELYNPKGLTYGPGNQLFVSNGGRTGPSAGNSFIGVANTAAGAYANTSGGASSALNVPYGIVYDGARYLYVNNTPNDFSADSTSAIVRIDTTVLNSPGVALTLQPTGGTVVNFNFSGLAFGPDGALYVSDNAQGNILRINDPDSASNTSSVSVIFSEQAGVNGFEGLAFDPASGKLYFALDNDSVRRATPTFDVNGDITGATLDAFVIQEAIGSGPTFLAFSPIPEPSTYALLGGAGAVLLVYGFRRRQQGLTTLRA